MLAIVLLSGFLLMHDLGGWERQAANDGSNTWVSAINKKERDGIPNYFMQPGPVLTVVDMQGVKQ